MRDKVIYPTLIKKYDDIYLAYVPDLDIVTEGSDEFDAISMARDAISLFVMTLQDEDNFVPDASSAKKAVVIAREKADREIDFSDGMLTYIDADIAGYRRKYRNLSVRKNCTIPAWMDDEATTLGINFSQVLQDALAQKLAAK